MGRNLNFAIRQVIFGVVAPDRKKKEKGPKPAPNARQQPARWRSTEDPSALPFFFTGAHLPNGEAPPCGNSVGCRGQRMPPADLDRRRSTNKPHRVAAAAPQRPSAPVPVPAPLCCKEQRILKPKKYTEKEKICQGKEKKEKKESRGLRDSFVNPLFPIFLYFASTFFRLVSTWGGGKGNSSSDLAIRRAGASVCAGRRHPSAIVPCARDDRAARAIGQQTSALGALWPP